MKYTIVKEDIVYQAFFKIKKATILHDAFKSDTQIKVVRECLDRGSAIAILLVEKDTDSILLTNQFRYPTITHPNYDGWLLEIVAGCMEIEEDPMECARREVEEEIGYEVKNMESMVEYFSSPGGSSEKVHAFYAEVNSTDKKFKGGGLDEEHEDIQLIKFPISEIKSKLKAQAFKDAKTIVALQWYLLNK
ncbi:NUDIX hydrolase [Formosa sp. L2A11]|uniref:NUDIX domain-containing protein n=1 Tax=Formosa sp. L2A11 TaxID=2686363 RepID=UPI00131E8029|nr:NUDIX hydrolase [Formosa sp. L2A11]